MVGGSDMGELGDWFDKHYPKTEGFPSGQQGEGENDVLEKLFNDQLQRANELAAQNEQLSERLEEMSNSLAMANSIVARLINAGPIIASLMADLDLTEFVVTKFDYELADTIDIEPYVDPEFPEVEEFKGFRMSRVPKGHSETY